MDKTEQKSFFKKYFVDNITDLLIIVLAVLVLEFSLFNIPHWATIGVGPSSNATDYTIRIANDIAVAAKNAFWAKEQYAPITILDIGHDIRTVCIIPDFGDTNIKMAEFDLLYRDENQEHIYTAQLVNGYEPSYYISLGAMGNVESLAVVFINEAVGIKEITFNTPLPWKFHGLRVFWIILVAVVIYYGKKYGFRGGLFDPSLAWQKRMDAGVVVLYISLMLFALVFSVDFGYKIGRAHV